MTAILIKRGNLATQNEEDMKTPGRRWPRREAWSSPQKEQSCQHLGFIFIGFMCVCVCVNFYLFGCIQSLLQHAGSLVVPYELLVAACGI